MPPQDRRRAVAPRAAQPEDAQKRPGRRDPVASTEPGCHPKAGRPRLMPRGARRAVYCPAGFFVERAFAFTRAALPERSRR